MIENNTTSELFKLKLANALAVLKYMNERRLINHKVHFDLWRRLLRVKTHAELDRLLSEISAIYQEKKGQ